MLRSTMMITLALAFAMPAIAAEPTVVGSGSFERDTFEYSSSFADGDKIKIEGKFLKSGLEFAYVVKPGGLVEGFAGDTPVRFHVSRAQRNRLANQINAARQPSFAQAGTIATTAR